MSDCTVFGNCFETDYGPFGVRLTPAFDPSPENGIICRGGPLPNYGLWDPDEKVAVACKEVTNTLNVSGLNSATSFSVPIFVGLTITNPSAVMVAQVYWAWYIPVVEIHASPGVRGTVITQSAVFPNPLQDVGYVLFQNNWPAPAQDFIVVPGSAEGFGDCPAVPPTILAPGASATRVWGFRFEGFGSPFGGWRTVIGGIRASAMAVTVPA